MKFLDLSDANITDEDLLSLQDLPSLEILVLRGTGVTSRGVRALRGWKFEELKLSRTAVDDGIADLIPTWPRLKRLYIDETQVSDRLIPSLKRHPSLLIATVEGTRVSKTAVGKLAELSAGLTIMGAR